MYMYIYISICIHPSLLSLYTSLTISPFVFIYSFIYRERNIDIDTQKPVRHHNVFVKH